MGRHTVSTGAACAVAVTPEQAERRGLLWVIGAFLICPCHLPLTLGLLVTALGGTALGALLAAHPWAAGAIISSTWVLATWHGVRHLRDAQRFARSMLWRGDQPPA